MAPSKFQIDRYKLKTEDFDYFLPAGLIAQTPIEPRDAARMLVLHRGDERQQRAIEHRHFHDLERFLKPGDLLVANDTRVMAARLFARKEGSGGRVELLLVNRREVVSSREQLWEVLAKPSRRLRQGGWLEVQAPAGEARFEEDCGLRAEVVGETAFGGRLVRFVAPAEVGRTLELLGSAPLPPYIHTSLVNCERYQTVFSRQPGSAAAPTAGLHFTAELIDRLARRGIRLAFVTLHIGLDTFRPIQVDDLGLHRMHSEFAELPDDTATLVRDTKCSGGRVIAVGTTVVRVLETAARFDVVVQPFRGWTDLFIRPGHRFKAVDALITNFHLPRSTLLVLVSAFAGRVVVARAYDEAILQGYRFYSFGDAMLIV